MEICDQYKQSWTEWQYKSYVPITGEGHGVYNANGTLNVERLSFFSRTYPHAVAGQLVSYSYGNTTRQFDMTYLVRQAVTKPTDIYLNEAVHTYNPTYHN